VSKWLNKPTDERCASLYAVTDEMHCNTCHVTRLVVLACRSRILSRRQRFCTAISSEYTFTTNSCSAHRLTCLDYCGFFLLPDLLTIAVRLGEHIQQPGSARLGRKCWHIGSDLQSLDILDYSRNQKGRNSQQLRNTEPVILISPLTADTGWDDKVIPTRDCV